MKNFWKTSIGKVQENEILVRGYPIEQLVRERSFGDVAYLLFTGELPKSSEGRLLEAVFVSCCEHSVAAPSVNALRFVASAGVPLQAAIAAGVLAVGEHHAGAIEACAQMLQEAVRNQQDAAAVFRSHREKEARLPGFGHTVHSDDPRTKALFTLASELKLSGKHIQLATDIESLSEQSIGKHLTINVDGGIAAVISDIGLDPKLGKAFFITGRSLGFAAHAFEEITKERPFRFVSPEDITYTGAVRRNIR